MGAPAPRGRGAPIVVARECLAAAKRPLKELQADDVEQRNTCAAVADVLQFKPDALSDAQFLQT